MFPSNSTLNYTRKESGSEILIFLHGFCEDLSMWDQILSFGFEKYDVLCLDLPGFGKSDPQSEGSIDQMATAVILLIDQLNIKKFKLFGHSMGGYVALAIADKITSRLTGFGLINSHPFVDSKEAKNSRLKSIDFIKKHGSALYVKQLIPNLFPESFMKSNRFLIEQLTFNANNYQDSGITKAQVAMISRKDQTRTMQRLPCPMLCIIGRLDTLMPIDKLIEQADHSSITDIVLLEHVGHMSPFENPKIVRFHLLNYLSLLNNYFK